MTTTKTTARSAVALISALLILLGLASAPAANAADPSVKVLDTGNTITDPTWFVKAYRAGFRLYVMHSSAWGTCDSWSQTQTRAQLKMAPTLG